MIAFAIFWFLQMLAPFGTFCLHNSEKFVKFVVIKTPGFTITNQRMQQLLQKEYEIGFHLNHPFVVQTIGIEQVPDLDTCIVMEYVDGLNWDDFMA